MKRYSFEELRTADLVVDATYDGGAQKNISADPVPRLLIGVGNQGGFRAAGPRSVPGCQFVVLFTTESEPDWPDVLDLTTGQFVYFGDNRRPGCGLHETPRGGNELLAAAFEASHDGADRRSSVPPFFVFRRTGSWDVQFRGLAAPGATGIAPTEDLVAVWRTSGGHRFQNYRAIFTILDVPRVPRAWLADLAAGRPFSPNAPRAWVDWVKTGRHDALRAPRTTNTRTPKEQLPDTPDGMAVVQAIYAHFTNAFDFERFAAHVVQLMDPNVVSIDVTRPWVDGGRDATGVYRIGPAVDPVLVEFAVEAKRFGQGGVGVKHTSRLISRLRFRQFGVLVTTSFVSEQAYREIREDHHPVLVIAARDLVQILGARGLSTPSAVRHYLALNFATGSADGADSTAEHP